MEARQNKSLLFQRTEKKWKADLCSKLTFEYTESHLVTHSQLSSLL